MKQFLKLKKRCFSENITITEISAEVNLQCLLNHTFQRILFVQKEVTLTTHFQMGL